MMDDMYMQPRPERPTHRTASVLMWVILIIASFGSFYVVTQLNESSSSYLRAQAELQKPAYSGSVDVVTLPQSDIRLNVPTWALFQNGNVWALISKSKPLPETYVPDDLTDISVPHGDASSPMKVSSRINHPLAQLHAAAKADGYNLAISSAYRSIADQQQLMDEFTATRGEALAREYVAEPGSSEHHTGLAVDFSDASPACGTDSDKCSLSLETAEWLADHAYKYGFILRYPEGARTITGISHEPWHYRYVGVALARAMHDSTITFDEFVELVR